MANLLFVTYHFAPESTSGTHRGLHFARALQNAGHSVQVITAPEPPPERADPTLHEVFPWPERVHRVQPIVSLSSVYMGLKHRWRPTAAPQTSPAAPSRAETRGARGLTDRVLAAAARLPRQVVVWDAFPDSRRPWGVRAVRKGIALGRREKFDAVFASGPPWTGVMTGYRIARALGIPFIADFRDPWTRETGATWVHHKAEWAEERARRWEARVLSAAAAITFNSPRLAEFASARNGLAGRVHIFLNGSDVPRSTESASVPTSGPLQFRHFGTLYAGRNIHQLVAALDHLIGAGRLRPEEVSVELIGDSELNAEEYQQITTSRVPVRLSPLIPFAEAARRMAEPSVLVSVQSERHTTMTPTKVFDYLCVGNPVVIVSPEASASWDAARGYDRSYRLDFAPTEHNTRTLAAIVDRWRSGSLRRERSVEDTKGLSKASIGADFVRLVESIVAGQPAGSGGPTR